MSTVFAVYVGGVFLSDSLLVSRQYRVQPYPDPDSPQTTTWMTQEQIYNEALKPSKKWVEAGHGEIGRVYVEVISCDDLPNLVRGRIVSNVMLNITTNLTLSFSLGCRYWRLYRSICGNSL